jgi:hypothetical protein
VIFLNVTKFNTTGIANSSDIESMRGTIQSMDGVHAVRVDNVSNTVTVEYEDDLSRENLQAAISKYKNTRH